MSDLERIDVKATRSHERIDEAEKVIYGNAARLEAVEKRVDDKSARVDRLEQARQLRVAHFGVVLSALAVIATVLGFAFFTRSEGRVVEGAVTAQSQKLADHIATQDGLNAEIKTRLDKQSETQRMISDNVIRIAEQLRVREIERPKATGGKSGSD